MPISALGFLPPGLGTVVGGIIGGIGGIGGALAGDAAGRGLFDTVRGGFQAPLAAPVLPPGHSPPPAMPDWLNTLLGRRVAATDPAARLAASLRRYLPFSAPHPGPGRTLRDAQAQANFSHFQSALTQRLHLVTELLRAEAQIDAEPALPGPTQHAAALTDALQRWASSAWPALPPQPRPTESHWLNSHRDGEDIVFSLLLDLAILLGEVIRRGNPAWHWGVNLDPQNIADDMPSARRVVLRADPAGTAPHAFVLDVQHVVVHRFMYADDAGQRLLNPFRRLVDEALRGDMRWRIGVGRQASLVGQNTGTEPVRLSPRA